MRDLVATMFQEPARRRVTAGAQDSNVAIGQGLGVQSRRALVVSQAWELLWGACKGDDSEKGTREMKVGVLTSSCVGWGRCGEQFEHLLQNSSQRA